MKIITFTKRFYELENIFVYHADTGDYLLIGYDSLRDAQEEEGDFYGWIKEYTKADIEQAVELGEKWPFELGLVELDDSLQNNT